MCGGRNREVGANGQNQDMHEEWLARLRTTYGDDLDVRTLPARQPQLAELPDWLGIETAQALERAGISSLWPHQRKALDAAHSGRDVVVATGTASGKSLTYQVPILEAVTADRKARALYIAPTKALARDQLRALEAFGVPGLGISAYDGDSDSGERAFARDYAEVIVTNPDMLHHSLLPGHTRWAKFLRGLSVIAVDECHMYRGMFGAHTAHVLRRLIRLSQHYGGSPQIVMASATVSDPARHAATLAGREFTAIDTDTSPRGEITIAMALPRPTVETAWEGDVIRRSVVAETADALADLAIEGVRKGRGARSTTTPIDSPQHPSAPPASPTRPPAICRAPGGAAASRGRARCPGRARGWNC
mgnify:CR=1 FL=1